MNVVKDFDSLKGVASDSLLRRKNSGEVKEILAVYQFLSFKCHYDGITSLSCCFDGVSLRRSLKKESGGGGRRFSVLNSSISES